MTNRTTILANLAALMGLSIQAAVALPTAVTVAAGKVRMSEDRFLSEMTRNAALRAYVAQVCEQVMA
jgi:hypothetical protein